MCDHNKAHIQNAEDNDSVVWHQSRKNGKKLFTVIQIHKEFAGSPNEDKRLPCWKGKGNFTVNNIYNLVFG